MNPRTPHSPIRPAAWLAALLCLATALAAEAPKVEPFEKDAEFLATKIAQYRYRLKSSREGEQRLSTMESSLTRLRSLISGLKDLAGEIESKEGKLRYLRTMELEPKQREIERLRQTFDAEVRRFQEERRSLSNEITRHNNAPHTFQLPEQAAGLQAYNAEKADLDARSAALGRRAEERGREMQQQFEEAVQAFGKIQQEFAETETKRDQALQKFQTQAGEYTGARETVVNELMTLDREPEPVPMVNVPLTPFGQGVRPEEAGTIPVARPLIGPGNNPRAIDQLRVVTKSSRDAAGRDEHDKEVTVPAEETARVDTSYTFDTGGGTGMADLPGVETPAAKQQEAVPLVVPPPPAEQPAAPAPLKDSPVVREFARQQSEGFSKLDQLYQQRRELHEQGAAASPEAWTKVVNDISKTQAEVNIAGVGMKLAEGSALLDLTIVPKAQKKLSDLTVPPPPPPSNPTK